VIQQESTYQVLVHKVVLKSIPQLKKFMNSAPKSLSLQLGMAALVLYLIKPHWFDNSLIGLIHVVSTVWVTTIGVLGLLIKTLKPSLYSISGAAVVRHFLGTVLLAVVSIKVQEVFPVYVGMVLGMVLFAFSILFQRKKIAV
jgi:hypothetical protein